ncbi:ammonium transporter [Cytophaga aurantiaca]|uniref:ammonium transporter n=1 Tax=Cytophaga aurantiaca TaxID=29530 RepID=UPI00037C67B0|nr:ammonium transporter [Cytophaga aurantiaca]
MPNVTPEMYDSVMLIKQQMLVDSLNLAQTALNDSLHATNELMFKTRTELAITKDTIANSSFKSNNVWMMVATALVFIMHLGFATLESGLTQAKNTTNVLFKNSIVPAIGILTHAICGFNFMYPGFIENVSMDFIGFTGWGIALPEGGETAAYNAGMTYWTDFLFQAMFAATAATIVSGAVAERIKLMSFMVFTTIFTAFIYPIIGSWKWGYGWLNTIGFQDFAGSTLVHSVGGWAALAGVILLGARHGKFEKGMIKPIPGHNMTSAVIGTFLLWLGWFGFNGGSVLSAEPGVVSRVLVMTCLSGSAGAIAASFTIFAVNKNFDLSMVLNGILAGLVGITAGANNMGILDSVIIGLVSGSLVVGSVIMFEKLKLDDPVGALSVHLVCGIWGTAAVGLFGTKAGGEQFITQLIGIGAVGITAFASSFIIFLIIKYTIGLRVDKEEEIFGLDESEHYMEAYPNFMTK